MRHRLAQIAADGSQKLPIRILPVLRAERSAGRMPEGAVRVLAAWIGHLRGAGAPVADPRADELVALAAGPLPGRARASSRTSIPPWPRTTSWSRACVTPSDRTSARTPA